MRGRDRGRRTASSGRNDEARRDTRHAGRALLAALDRRANEADEQRMPAPWIRREFGVELAAEEPRVLRQLDHLAQVAGRLALRPRADDETGRFDSRQVMVVDLIPVPMALGHR